MWETLAPLLQALLGAVATALATRIGRRLWRQQRILRAAVRHVRAVDEELDRLIHQGEAEYSNLARTKRMLAVARLREQFPHLTEHEAIDLVLAVARRP